MYWSAFIFIIFLTEMRITLRFLYKGKFYFDREGHLYHRKGLVHFKNDVDPDLLSKVVLEAM